MPLKITSAAVKDNSLRQTLTTKAFLHRGMILNLNWQKFPKQLNFQHEHRDRN